MLFRRVYYSNVFCIILLFTFQVRSMVYKIPDVKIQVYQPKGFSASIPDEPGISLFVFQGNINENLRQDSVGTLSGEITRPLDGRWTFEDPDIKLKIGDVINYYIVVSVNRAGYVKDSLKYTVKEFSSRTGASTDTPGTCNPTSTIVNRRTVCSGQVIFEEHFDKIDNNTWQIEHRIPTNHNEHPFVSYQNLLQDPTVLVKNGQLHIKPKLQETEPGFSSDSMWQGTLDLFDRCTSTPEECLMKATGAVVLPPVVSGRIRSVGFAFQYGRVDIRAKLPKGDWVYPEVLLEPLLSKYGYPNFASGIIKVAFSRGNPSLSDGNGNTMLYSGVIMDLKCYNTLLHQKSLSDNKFWSDDFHIYSIKWTPDDITFIVDGTTWARLLPDPKLRDNLRQNCDHPVSQTWENGGKMAPFDQQFYLTLGLAAGGITAFPDNILSSSRRKPWKNSSNKASLHFWQDQPNWFATWNGDTALVVDYVKVTAL